MRDPRRAVGRSAVRRYVVSAGLSPVFDADERFVIDAVVAVAAAVDAGSYVCSGCDGVNSIITATQALLCYDRAALSRNAYTDMQ